MSAKYASYLNIEINSALWGLGIIFLTNTLTIDATRLLPIYGINGKKETGANLVNGYES